MSLLNTNIGPERVQVFPQPLGNLQIPGAGISTLSMLISTSLVGAVENVATPVQNLEQFVEAFGGPDEVANGAYYSVKGFFDNAGTGSTVYVVNVGATPTAADYIGDAAASSGLRALDAIDNIGLVTAPGLPLSQAYLVNAAVIDYTETVRAEFGATLTTSFSLVAIPKEITQANKDTNVLVPQLSSITGAGPWVMTLQDSSAGVAAIGAIDIGDYTGLTGATVTVGGVAFVEGVDWTAAVSNAATASSLASAITLGSLQVEAVDSGATVNITALVAGVAGNSITLAVSDLVNMSVSGATLEDGSNGPVSLSAVLPGMLVKNSAGTYSGVIRSVSDVDDTITVTPNPSTFFDPSDDVIIAMPSAISYKNSIVANAVSKAAAWYFNSVVVLDESSAADDGDVVVVDPVGHVAGVIARIDAQTSIGGPSHAPAGLQYAGIAGIQGLALTISERTEGGPLRLNFINRITNFSTGPVIFGGYTADSGVSPTFTAAEQLIQVIRTLQFIKASLEPGLRAFIWENYSPDTIGLVVASIESFLRNNSYLFPSGLPETSKFKVMAPEVTKDDMDQGLLRVIVQVKPNRAVRFIEVALQFPLP